MSISKILFFTITGLFCPLFLISQDVPSGYSTTSRQKISLNQDWMFYLEKDQGDQKELKSKAVDWEPVSIPHTLELAPSDVAGLDSIQQYTFHRNVGWYKRELTVTATKTQRIFLEFEGVHQVTNLWVNGKYVGEHAVGGYTPFHFDVSDVIKRDGSPNEILLSADNRLNADIPPDGNQYDYIKFSGLYRDVYLVTTDEVYVTFPWEAQQAGVFITTPSVTPQDATVDVRTTVRNTADIAKNTKVITRIVDADGFVVGTMQTTATISAKSDHTFSQIGGITENLKLWSIDSPYRYRVHTTIYVDEKAVDLVQNPLGIRKFEFVRDKGFLLNGKPVELIGANRHQAYPFIGDAVPNSLHWKDAWQFKQAGFNVVRLAHYPHDNAFIEACDELGILVYEEPPSWIGIGGEKWFDNLEEATRRMVRNHRNHPSILMWGASLNHRGPVPRLHYACKQEDPTRMTASNGSPWSGPRNSGVTDIYTPMDYQNMELNPNEFIFLCEHGSSADARRNQFEVSKARASANHLGVAVWTAHDYQSFKPNRGMNARRIFSLYREPNPVYHWYRSEMLDTPVVHIADKRASEEKEVIVFSNCEAVALYQDGELIAKQLPDSNEDRLYVDHPTFTFDYNWQQGKLTAKGLKNGKKISEHSLKKARKPYQIKLVIEDDDRPFYANASDIKMVKAYIVDEEGNHVSADSKMVSFSVEGPGSIVGDAAIGANPNRAYFGVASALIKSGAASGKITVRASAVGLKPSQASIMTLSYESDRTLAEAHPIYEPKRAKFDIGGAAEQLVQFGWSEWSPSVAPVSKDFPDLKLKVEGEDTQWSNGWGLSSDLAYVGADGVKAERKMIVTIAGLPKGKYTFTSYHHLMEEANEQVNYHITVESEKGTEPLILSPTQGNRLANSEPASGIGEFSSDGKTPVRIHINNSDNKFPVVLNGIKILEVIHKL